jgi:hypothetical protein
MIADRAPHQLLALRLAAISSPIKMLRVKSVKPLEAYAVKLTLTDGSTRIMDLRPWLKGRAVEPLRRDILLFQKVGVEHGTQAWLTGQDLDPDVLLDTEISRSARAPRRRTMAAICRFDGMTVYINANGHFPPHVHVVHGSDMALVLIRDGKVFEGALPPKALKPIRQWLKARRAELSLEWVRAASGQRPRRVAHLDE